jgi:transcriptional regulator with XRE-family HTH domain
MHYARMKLDQYLTELGLTEAEFARLTGLYQSTIHRLKRGQIPGPATMARIAEVTGGKVSANDFYGIKP